MHSCNRCGGCLLFIMHISTTGHIGRSDPRPSYKSPLSRKFPMEIFCLYKFKNFIVVPLIVFASDIKFTIGMRNRCYYHRSLPDSSGTRNKNPFECAFAQFQLQSRVATQITNHVVHSRLLLLLSIENLVALCNWRLIAINLKSRETNNLSIRYYWGWGFPLSNNNHHNNDDESHHIENKATCPRHIWKSFDSWSGSLTAKSMHWSENMYCPYVQNLSARAAGRPNYPGLSRDWILPVRLDGHCVTSDFWEFVDQNNHSMHFGHSETNCLLIATVFQCCSSWWAVRNSAR